MSTQRFMGRTLFSFAIGVAACGGTAGAHPHDMSAEHHEAAAAGQEAEASRHESMAQATADREPCSAANAHAPTTDACWSSLGQATDQHLREAERHHRMAADHRAASQVLRDAETRACGGLRDSDRDMSPFEHREDIASVAPLTERSPGRTSYERTVGVVVTFVAVPGMTAEWLQRVVDCHVARNAALGHDVPEMTTCPLVPNDITARVSSTGHGFAVAIRTENEASLREVQRRAALLTAPGAHSAAL